MLNEPPAHPHTVVADSSNRMCPGTFLLIIAGPEAFRAQPMNRATSRQWTTETISQDDNTDTAPTKLKAWN